MKKSVIYALDFDGVICDSAIETGITGWKAAIQIWPDMKAPLPSTELINQFRLARPVIETGFEAILIMRLLYLGQSIDSTTYMKLLSSRIRARKVMSRDT